MSAELSCFVPVLFDSMEVMRGKRTKRLSLSSSCGYGGASALTSSSGSEDRDGGKEDLRLVSSATVSGEEEEEEEQDMANCLILLAQGHGSTQLDRLNDKSGFYVYECKTCNRTFPSFQSLGGHRASHKRPKQTAMGGEKKASSYTLEALQFNKNSYTHPPTSKGSLINKGKIHECSICGLEFTSGQALGGHMRRHRATSTGESRSNVGQTHVGMELKQRNLLQLDLNMPAPEEDLRDSKFQFVRTQQPLVFSTPALVDCHY